MHGKRRALRLRCQEMTPNHLATGYKSIRTCLIGMLRFMDTPPLIGVVNIYLLQNGSRMARARTSNSMGTGPGCPGVGLESVWQRMHTVPAAVCLVVMPGNRSRHVVQVDTSSEASWEWNLLILDWTAGWWRRGCAETRGGLCEWASLSR